MSSGSDHTVAACFLPTAAGLRAGAPLAVLAHDAINGASIGVARLLLVKHGAGVSTELRVNKHTAGTTLCAGVARLGAVRPLGPVRHEAVHGARAVSACLSLTSFSGTGDASKAGLANNKPVAILDTSATSGAASAPRIVGRHDAVNRACLSVALATLDRSGTSFPTEGRFNRHRSVHVLLAGTAGLRASRPCTPSGHLAVNGAAVGVAGAVIGQLGTRLATMLGRHNHRAGAGVISDATALGTSTKVAPARNDTVHRAGVSVAVAGPTGG